MPQWRSFPQTRKSRGGSGEAEDILTGIRSGDFEVSQRRNTVQNATTLEYAGFVMEAVPTFAKERVRR